MVAVRGRIEGDTPPLIVGVYGHSAIAGQARQLQYDLGEDYVALGDWNRTVDENPMATLIANGKVSFGDEPRGTIETDTTACGFFDPQQQHDD